jgi:phosphoribosylamine--glycine ligase
VKLLLVGGGGREHALAWKLKRDDPELEITAAPGNPGIATIARCRPVAATDIGSLLDLARSDAVDCVIVGPEAPLALGIVDRFNEAQIPIFGPTRAAARIETSKSFAKQLMRDAGVPTARAETHTDPDAAKRAAREFGLPVVVKATGLAAGKGVVVARSMEDADRAIDMMLRDHDLGDAGTEVLIEEFMSGEELSVFALTDGTNYVTMLPVQDHKAIGNGDTGPNTGGMGAYAPVSIGSTNLVESLRSLVFDPTLRAMADSGSPFRGLLYAGIMLTHDGPKVVEFNCRFGDPETEAILPLMRSSLLDLIGAVAAGDGLGRAPAMEWYPDYAVTTVVAAPGYPSAPRTNQPLVLPSEHDGVIVFHAGTSLSADGHLTSSGGRVLAVTGVSPTLSGAQKLSREHAEKVRLDGKQIRTDIGWRDLQRHARVT